MITRRYPIPFIGGTFEALIPSYIPVKDMKVVECEIHATFTAGLKGYSTFAARVKNEPAPENSEVVCDFVTPAGCNAVLYRIKKAAL
jgi:hypothetical protein